MVEALFCSSGDGGGNHYNNDGKGHKRSRGAPTIEPSRAEFVSRMVPRPKNVAAMRGAPMESRGAEFVSHMVP
jgi:hypothetical protein